MELNNFKKFGLEVILKVLKKTDDEIKRYKELEDYEGVKTLEDSVLSKYEQLYTGFTSGEIDSIDANQLAALESSLVDIMLQNGFTLEFINSEIEKRDSLQKEAGSEAVKNLYNFHIEELEGKKNELLKKAEAILDKEAILEAELSEAIQEEDQMPIIEQMPEIRKTYRKVSDQIMFLQSQITSLKEKVSKGWPCDIYGTISKEELMNIFKKTVK